MRVVVVGTGIAGLITAYRASMRHEIVLVTKAELAESNTKYAQGGIAAVMFPDDSVSSHVADTLRAGAGLSDRHAVEVLCTEGPERVRDLIALGVEFDRLANGELARGHEAAHSARRVLHAGGDATGLAIEVGLLEAVRTLAVEVHEHTFLTDLVVESSAGLAPRVVGVDVIGPDGTAQRIDADAVVIASGGAGQLFAHTTNPRVTTGDGVAAALRAGALVSDLEFYQFHPTALAVPGTPLVSEAVRGEGAVLLDEHGHRFMLDVHPDGELAPRDVVARGIAAAMERQGGRPVLLDATSLGAELLATRFPGITRAVTAAGFDWSVEPIPVTPAAHYWMGGISSDDAGRTSLAGLYAVGEAACTGVHGANRLASNSLLESLVFAWRAADALDGPELRLRPRGEVRELSPVETPPVEPVETPPVELVETPHASTRTSTPVTRESLQTLMWTHVGLDRTGADLREARALLAAWTAEARPENPTIRDREDANLLDLARAIVDAAIWREESRGAHARTDFPETRADFARSMTWTKGLR